MGDDEFEDMLVLVNKERKTYTSEQLQKVSFALHEMKEKAQHLIPEAIEPWILEMQLSSGNAFSQLRDKLDSTMLVTYKDQKLKTGRAQGA